MEIREVELLKEFKKKSGWSYNKIANEIGVTQLSIQNWFSGKHKPTELARKAIKAFLIEHYQV